MKKSGVSLAFFILFCAIVTGVNLVVIAFCASIGPGSVTFTEWKDQNHTFMLMFLAGIDMISFATLFLNSIEDRE